MQSVQGPQKVKVGSSDKIVTAKNIIIATGSVPFVRKGIEIGGTYQSIQKVNVSINIDIDFCTKIDANV